MTGNQVARVGTPIEVKKKRVSSVPEEYGVPATRCSAGYCTAEGETQVTFSSGFETENDQIKVRHHVDKLAPAVEESFAGGETSPEDRD